MSKSDTTIIMAEFGRAVGLKGEIRLKSYLQDPSRLCEYNPYTDAEGRTYTIKSARIQPGTADMFVVRVEGVEDRTSAEALNRRTLSILRTQLDQPTDEDTFLSIDLIGLTVKDADNNVLGTVVDVANYGAGDILEVKPVQGHVTALIPFQNGFIIKVDVEMGYLTICDPSLLDTSSPEDHKSESIERASKASDKRAAQRKNKQASLGTD